MIKGIIGAVIGGAIGATIWALISYYTNYEIGWIAWGIGAMVGAGMMVGARDVQSSMCGVIAAVIAVASIVGGKFAAVAIDVHQYVAKMQKDSVVTEDYTKIYVAHQLVEEYEAGRKPLKWPEGYSAETATESFHFPPDLWKDLESRWKALSDAQKATYQQATEAQFNAYLVEASQEARTEAFKGSFSFWDALWFFLAVGTAYKVGSGEGDE